MPQISATLIESLSSTSQLLATLLLSPSPTSSVTGPIDSLYFLVWAVLQNKSPGLEHWLSKEISR